MVIGIASLLVSLVLTGLRGARDTARRAVCLSNLRQGGLLTEMIANDDDGLLPFWLANAPGSPTLGRSDQQTIYGPHLGSWEIFICPADRTTPREDWSDGDYTSYEYWPGVWMNDYAESGRPNVVRSITVLFRNERVATVLYDRERWHPNGPGRNGVHLPDMHSRPLGN